MQCVGEEQPDDKGKQAGDGHHQQDDVQLQYLVELQTQEARAVRSVSTWARLCDVVVSACLAI